MKVGFLFTFKGKKTENKPANKKIHNPVKEDMNSTRHLVVKTLAQGNMTFLRERDRQMRSE